ncbi:MAG: hypothetical protein OHK93_003784 [Ramalina farinacea]|uniref:Rhodopsin domain-containing protein n=1 Tax=Ramalina farinacea TaxID=258253 RepID=A0AA43U076_9LECA|nr:hypothetical protein [Ramalina farinacea]
MSRARGKASPQEIEYMIIHYDDNRGPELVAALSINIALAIIFVFLRCLARRTIRSPLQADDWMIFITLIVACGQYITGIIGVHVGLGKHSIVLKGDYAPWAKCSIAYAILYVVATALVKISVLCLYRRLFGSKRNFKLASWIISGIIIIYTSVSALGSSFQCIPVASLWNLNIDGYCFNYRLAAFINATLNIIMEIVILVLPAHAIWSLQLGTKLKLQILAILLLGALYVWQPPFLHRLCSLRFALPVGNYG